MHVVVKVVKLIWSTYPACLIVSKNIKAKITEFILIALRFAIHNSIKIYTEWTDLLLEHNVSHLEGNDKQQLHNCVASENYAISVTWGWSIFSATNIQCTEQDIFKRVQYGN